MSEPLKKYEFDPTGRLANNAVYNDPYTITPLNGIGFNFVVIKNAPFFRESLTVVERSSGKKLIDGVDYLPTHKFRKAKEIYGIDVYGSITLLGTRSAVNGNILVSYQTLGGPFIRDHDALISTVVQEVAEARVADYLTIFDVPSTYDAMPHFADVKNIIGFDDVVDAIKQLTLVVEKNITPDHRHEISQIKGLSLFVAQAISNAFNYKVCLGDLKLSAHTGAIALNIPKFILETQISVELKVLLGGRTYNITVSGIIPDAEHCVFGQAWTEANVSVIGGLFGATISASFNEDGNPTIYFGDETTVWEQTQIGIASVLCDVANPEEYIKNWVLYKTGESVGDTLKQFVIDGEYVIQ